MRVYYENEEVRNIVNDYEISKSPYLHIHEQLERIALEHSRQSVSTEILNDFNDNARKKVSEPPEPVKEEKSEEKVQQPLLLEEAMDKLQPLIDQKVAEAIGRMFMNNMNMNMNSGDIAKSISANVGESVRGNMDIPTPVSSAPVIPASPTLFKPVIEPETKYSEPVVSIPKSIPESAPKIDSAVESSDAAPRKPASFGKLLGSMK